MQSGISKPYSPAFASNLQMGRYRPHYFSLEEDQEALAAFKREREGASPNPAPEAIQATGAIDKCWREEESHSLTSELKKQAGYRLVL